MPGASKDFGKETKSLRVIISMLIAGITMAQFIVLAIFATVVYQTERKIFTLQMEPNTPEEVSKEKKVNGETELKNTDM